MVAGQSVGDERGWILSKQCCEALPVCECKLLIVFVSKHVTAFISTSSCFYFHLLYYVYLHFLFLVFRRNLLITPLRPGESQQPGLFLYVVLSFLYLMVKAMTFDPCATLVRFAGGMLRVQAEATLLNRQNSTYLVRHRGHENNEYAISIK